MKPLDPVTAILLLGLCFMINGHINTWPAIETIGNVICIIGWILNIVANAKKEK